MHICEAKTIHTLQTKSNIYSSKLRTAFRGKQIKLSKVRHWEARISLITIYLLVNNVSCTWNVHWILCPESLQYSKKADPVPQFSPALFRQVWWGQLWQRGTVILGPLKHFDSYLNSKNGLGQIRTSTFCRPGLPHNTTKMWTVDLTMEKSRTSPGCSTSCQICETRWTWSRSANQPQKFYLELFFFLFFFSLSSPIKVTTSL